MVTSAKVKIRKGGYEDIANLKFLLKILFTIEEDFVVDESRQHQGLSLMLENKNACVLVAETDNAVVGMCTGQLTISTAEGGPAVLVEDMVVDSNWRGRGIGRQLLEEIARWGKGRGANRLQLLADSSNISALRFYEKVGWSRTSLICLRRRQDR